ncbi:hypothetical protein BDV97DRAFT_41548 [Delphinella strobiligena]|nr:hypothetical protein BDV97DRAFT_41548 [Delphinella strobiligena]
MMIAAPHSDQNLCKTLVSSAVLGYPGATLVGWGEYLEEENPTRELSPLETITQIRDFLVPLSDTDLVIIVDGYNSWFQLRPQTLLDRFYSINQAADRRTYHELGIAASKYDLSQKIVFPAQKSCSPWSSNDPSCYAVPSSILAANLYGPNTDKAISDPEKANTKTRPRFLSTGLAIGEVKAMRALYTEASNRMQQDPTLQTSHQVFSQIFGEQAIHREILRRESKGWLQSLTGAFSTDARDTLFKPEHTELVKSRGRPLEFHVGLDYEGALGFTTESAHEDAAWIIFDDEERIYTANEVLGIKQEDSRIDSIQSDILGALPPFWTFSEEGLPRGVGWRQAPLLTNVWTGVSPAVIQHTGIKSLRETWWDDLWFHTHARTMYSAHVYAPRGPVAVSGDDKPRKWWSPEDWTGGARNTTGSWYRYDDICDGTEDEVFRDGEGRWLVPENH